MTALPNQPKHLQLLDLAEEIGLLMDVIARRSRHCAEIYERDPVIRQHVNAQIAATRPEALYPFQD